MKISRRKLFAILTVAALVAVPVVYGLSAYFTVNNSFTVATNLTVPYAQIGYDAQTPVACTAGTFPAFTCPNTSFSTIYPSDTIAYQFLTSTGRPSATPTLTVTPGGTYAGTVNTANSYIACTGANWSDCTGTPTTGTPVMSAGITYEIISVTTLAPSQSTGSFTLALSWSV